jgi:hypothetical protein
LVPFSFLGFEEAWVKTLISAQSSQRNGKLTTISRRARSNLDSGGFINSVSIDRLNLLSFNRRALVLFLGILNSIYQLCSSEKTRLRNSRWADVHAHVAAGKRQDDTHHFRLEDARKDGVTLLAGLNVECLA